MQVALVHDWLIQMRGGEKVLESLCELYPHATIYTLFARRRRLSLRLQQMNIKTSFLQWFPGIHLYYRWLLPLFPWAIRSLKISHGSLIISSSHCVSKGVSFPVGAKHICYCHTPMRYAWGFQEDYFGKFPNWIRRLLEKVMTRLRAWDLDKNRQVNVFIANSNYIKERIKTYYDRDASVIYPPCETEQFKLGHEAKEDYYLVVSAFVPYKKVDLAIEAFNDLDRILYVVGDGPERKRYEGLKRNKRIRFLGSISGTELIPLYQRAKALIFPTEEDFGIVPIEAQACGTPVIAFAKGGALEGVKSGIFFEEQTAESLKNAIMVFEKKSFNSAEIAEKVQFFSKERFQKEMQNLIQEQHYARC